MEFRRSCGVGIACVVAVAACGNSVPADTAALEAQQDSAAFVEQADGAAMALAGTLGARLTAAVTEGGPAHAIDFCSSAALQLTDSVAAEHDVLLQRVSDRWRNPANAPDATDREVLAALDSIMATGAAPPAHLVQRDADGGLRYYRPLLVNVLCLNCHGATDALAPTVARALAERYPEDRATGYSENELRGVIRVRSRGGSM
jgi:hypothetical protein